MSKHLRSSSLSFIGILCFSVWTFSSLASATEPVEQLSDLLKKIETLRGKFSYISIDEEGEELDSNTGNITLQRPGLFRWEVDPPYPQIIVSDRKSLWNYDPDFEQVIVKPYDDRLEQTPAVLLSGDVDAIKNNFNVQLLDNSDNVLHFRLEPRDQNQEFENLEISFSGEILMSMSFSDTLGQTFSYQFSDLILNQPIAKSTFVFEIPPGVEVLTDEQ